MTCAYGFTDCPNCNRTEVAETLDALRADRRDRRRHAHVAALLAFNALPHDPERATMRLGEHLEHHREVLALDRTILELEATT